VADTDLREVLDATRRPVPIVQRLAVCQTGVREGRMGCHRTRRAGYVRLVPRVDADPLACAHPVAAALFSLVSAANTAGALFAAMAHPSGKRA
jgi:hypothetical protein